MMNGPTRNRHMATSDTRDAQPKEAGSRFYGIPDGPTRELEFKEDRENVLEDMGEDWMRGESGEEGNGVPHLTGLPEIPTGDDLKFDLDSFSFMTPTSEVEEKVHKRASNVLKLTQENEKLQAQLKAMAEQLEGMERLRAQLAAEEPKK